MQNRPRAMPPLLVLAACVAVTVGHIMPINDVAKPQQVNAQQREAINYRLDGKIIPSNYVIKITPNFIEDKTDTFSGEVKINALATDDTQEIVLHSASNINEINDLVVCLKSNEENCEDNPLTNNPPFSRNDEAEFLTINLKDTLRKEQAIIIIISYEAYYPEGMYGFYKSTYTFSKDDKEREDVLLTTQFQPTHARKAFPCFDEPSYKATFDITLVVPEGYGGLSNAGIKITSTKDEKAVLTPIYFETTPKMSTYLVAFIIYKEESFESTKEANGELPFKTWARSSEIAFGALSQTDGPNAIKKMEDFTGVLYSDYAKKIDQAAIPDFSAGAMENWGLVTYRETALLYNAAEHTEATKERVATVIAHELAHQWFGNLVTTEWWDSTWLNEGFATYFEYYIPSLLHTDWRMMERMVTEVQLAAFSADETSSAGPLTKEVNSPDEISNHFSTITYDKGGSVLRMFANIIGEEKFQSALHEYLTDNALGSVTPDKLISALTKDVGDVGLPQGSELEDIFKSWTNTQGFPLITVTHGQGDLKIKQQQFLSDETASSNVYNVLLTLKSNDANFEDKKIWLLSEEVSVAEAPDTGSWILVPTDGYFRVNYDEENWGLLTEELRESSKTDSDSTIDPLERAILIDNALNLARIDTLPYSIAINLLSYLENELDYLPWSVALSGLNYMHRMLWNEGETMDKFLLHIIDNVYEDLGAKLPQSSSAENHVEHLHRANVFSWACRIGHPNCIRSATEHLTSYLDVENGESVLPNLRSIVYCYGVKHDERLWTKLWRKLGETDDAAERALIISALGCASNPNTLYMYLQKAVVDDAVRAQDVASVFSAVNTNLEGADVTLEFLDFKLSDTEHKTETVMNGMSSILRGTARYIKTEQQKKQFEKIANAIDNEVDRVTAQNALAAAESNFEWLEHKDEIISELEKALEGTNPTEAPPTEAPPTQAPPTQAPPTEAPPTEAPPTEAPPTQAPPTQAPPTEPPTDPPTTKGAWAIRPTALLLSLAAALPLIALLL